MLRRLQEKARERGAAGQRDPAMRLQRICPSRTASFDTVVWTLVLYGVDDQARSVSPPSCAQRGARRRGAPGRRESGKLDAEAVAAVLAAAGHSVGRRREWPAGLTTREIDVLRLVARGLSSKQIAAELVITPKTARNHIEHIYTKIDASSRVAASLFATEHGLL